MMWHGEQEWPEATTSYRPWASFCLTIRFSGCSSASEREDDFDQCERRLSRSNVFVVGFVKTPRLRMMGPMTREAGMRQFELRIPGNCLGAITAFPYKSSQLLRAPDYVPCAVFPSTRQDTSPALPRRSTAKRNEKFLLIFLSPLTVNRLQVKGHMP